MRKELDYNFKNDISILDNSHCSILETSYTITKSYTYEDNSYYFKVQPILGEDVNILGYFNNVSLNLDSKEGTSLFYLSNNDSNGEKTIYRDKQGIDPIASIKAIKYGIYKVEFLNSLRDEYEYIEMVSDKKLQVCVFFYGDEKRVIGKIIRKNRNGNFEIEIASCIDYIFMLGLASFFFCEDLYSNDELKTDDENSLMRKLSYPIKKLSMRSSDRNINRNIEKEQNSKCYLRNCNDNDCNHSREVKGFKRKYKDCCRPCRLIRKCCGNNDKEIKENNKENIEPNYFG